MTIRAVAGAGLCLALLAAGCGGSASSGSTGGAQPVTVGVLVIAQAQVLDQTVQAFEDELRSKAGGRKVSFTVKNANGDTTLIQSIVRDFVDSGDTMFAVIGTPAVIAMAKAEKRRPIIALAIGDPVGAGVARSLDHPGGNVTGSVDYVNPKLLLAQLAQTAPKPARIGTVYDPSNANMQVWIKDLRAAVAASPGLSLTEATISGSGDIATAARSLAGRVDTLLIGPDASVFAGMAAIAGTAKTNRLPLYVVAGDPSIDGVVASLGPDYPTIGRLAGDAAGRVLAGSKPGDVPFGRPSGVEWSANQATASRLGVTIPAQPTPSS
jgi:putative ABC transport system substrate-binding protein